MNYSLSQDGVKAIMHAPNPEDHIVRHWRQGRFYEGKAGQLLDWMWNDYYLKVSDDRVMVDIGAHWGNHMVFALRSKLFTRVIGFEPDQGNFATCSHNLQLNQLKGYTLFRAALGDAARMGCMTLPNHGANNSGMMRFSDALDEVPMMRLNDLAIDRCDLLKVDVERLERQVLLGGWEFLERLKPLIAIEVLDEDMKEVSKVLNQIGYTMLLQTANSTPTYIFRAL